MKLICQIQPHEVDNLDARRDWGFAPKYVERMWRRLRAEQPDDHVLATNETHSIREFLEAAFGYGGLDWRNHIAFDPRYLRPAEVDRPIGDCAKARRLLGWKPRTRMVALARRMVDADIKGFAAAGVDRGQSGHLTP